MDIQHPERLQHKDPPATIPAVRQGSIDALAHALVALALGVLQRRAERPMVSSESSDKKAA